MGPLARRRGRAFRELVRRARRACPRSRRGRAQGRPVRRRDDGDGDRVARPRRARSARRRDDRRDHAVGAGAAHRRTAREVARCTARRPEAHHLPARERARPRRVAAGDAQGARVHPGGHDRRRLRKRVHRRQEPFGVEAPAGGRAGRGTAALESYSSTRPEMSCLHALSELDVLRRQSNCTSCIPRKTNVYSST